MSRITPSITYTCLKSKQSDFLVGQISHRTIIMVGYVCQHLSRKGPNPIIAVSFWWHRRPTALARASHEGAKWQRIGGCTGTLADDRFLDTMQLEWCWKSLDVGCPVQIRCFTVFNGEWPYPFKEMPSKYGGAQAFFDFCDQPWNRVKASFLRESSMNASVWDPAPPPQWQ